MKRRIPKIGDDGDTIICECQGEGCSDCDYEGVEMEDNEKYWDMKIEQEEARRYDY